MIKVNCLDNLKGKRLRPIKLPRTLHVKIDVHTCTQIRYVSSNARAVVITNA